LIDLLPQFEFLQSLFIIHDTKHRELDLSKVTLFRCKRFECRMDEIKLPVCEGLICYRCNIKVLSQLPACTHLDCSFNMLFKLPDLPKIQHLDISHNEISKLNNIPHCTYLNCEANRLTHLPKVKFGAHKSFKYNELKSQRVKKFIEMNA